MKKRGRQSKIRGSPEGEAVAADTEVRWTALRRWHLSKDLKDLFL